MTDFQYKSVLLSVEMILDGCKTVEEAKKKIEHLRNLDKKEPDQEQDRD